jgi:hypothetical protein
MPISIHSTKAKAEGIDMSVAVPNREVATEEFNGRRALTLDARADDNHELVDPASQT